MRLNKWKYLFKSYFTYTKREQNAIVVLLLLIGSLQFVLVVLHWFPAPVAAVAVPNSQRLLPPNNSLTMKSAVVYPKEIIVIILKKKRRANFLNLIPIIFRLAIGNGWGYPKNKLL